MEDLVLPTGVNYLFRFWLMKATQSFSTIRVVVADLRLAQLQQVLLTPRKTLPGS